MPDLDERDTDAGPATATVEPPAPPAAPPATGTATGPRPGRRRRWVWWLVGVLALVAIIAAVVGVFALVARNHGTRGASPAASASAFDSAMAKAGVKATVPTRPVELTSVSATGSHPFEADFSAEELSALINAFTYTTDVDGQKLSVTSATIEIPGDGTMALSGTVTLGENSYSGSIAGPVGFENGQVTSTGATSVSAEGFPIGGAQAQQATTALLGYVNDYLAAAPGLKIEAAQLSGTNVHVKGTAPDSITAP